MRELPGRLPDVLSRVPDRARTPSQRDVGAVDALLKRVLSKTVQIPGLRLDGGEALAHELRLDLRRFRERGRRSELPGEIQGGTDILLGVVQPAGEQVPGRGAGPPSRAQ